MGFLVSPGVHVKEIDLTNVVPSVATSIGAIAGGFAKGPYGEIVTVSSEEELVKVFGKPDPTNQGVQIETWFAAANFLKYSDTLRVVRAGGSSVLKNASISGSAIIIRNDDHYQESFSAGQASVGEWAARQPGTHGNSIGVSYCATAAAFEEKLGVGKLVNDADAQAGETTITVDAGTDFVAGDIISFYTDGTYNTGSVGHEGVEYEVVSIATHVLTIRKKDDINGTGLVADLANDQYIKSRWQFYDLFDSAPGTSTWATQNGRGAGDEMHIVVYDITGDITGYDHKVAGNRTASVLETYEALSKCPIAKTAQGGTNYVPDVIFLKSEYVYWMDWNAAGGAGNWGTDTSSAYTAAGTGIAKPTGGGPSGTEGHLAVAGVDDTAISAGDLKVAYDLFADTESVDVNLIIGGQCGTNQGSHDTHVTMITDLCELRKDCVGFVSPYRNATVDVTSSITQTANVIEAFQACPSSSYMVFDSGHKYMFDKYNDVYRYVPLNGDTAGLCANTDAVADPWYSPAGYTRGNVRGAIKLSYNPKNSERDQLYRHRINPVTNFPGQGVVLFGDKTALAKPSAFDRINVRRLFLVLEKPIATAAKYQLFEFNDEFTRAQFRAMVEPFLRDVQGRRGIFDFKVVCDGTNNTGEVIDRNEFIGDIYIKPARSINFITLNFIAVRTGVSFSEVGG